MPSSHTTTLTPYLLFKKVFKEKNFKKKFKENFHWNEMQNQTKPRTYGVFDILIDKGEYLK